MRKLLTLGPLLLLAGGLLFLRPLLLGGDVSYVIVTGVSMRPTLWQGDLALARRAANYELGDVVAYHSPEGPLVIHRIIGREGDAFTFQGDNNDFVDPWTATPEQIAGKAWVAIPRLGALFSYLQNPVRLAAAVGAFFLYISLAGLFLARPLGSRKRRRRLRDRALQRRRGRLTSWLSS